MLIKIARLLAVVMTAVGLCCCSAGKPAGLLQPQTGGGQADPVQSINTGGEDTSGPFSLASPQTVLAGITLKSGSQPVLTRDGWDYDPQTAKRAVGHGNSARLEPDFVPGTDSAGISLAIYHFNATEAGGHPTVKLDWGVEPGERGNIWIGTSDWDRKCWKWHHRLHTLPGSVLDLGKNGYLDTAQEGTGDMLVAIVLLGTEAAQLDKVMITPSQAGQWPMFGHNEAHRGISPYSGAHSAGMSWSYAAGGKVKSSPALASDGTVYFGSRDGNLYAVDSNGDLEWSYPTGSRIDSSPAVDADGTVYFGCDDHCIYAVSRDGDPLWTYKTGSNVRSSPVVGLDGMIYVGSEDKHLYAFYPDGELKWSFPTAWEVKSSPAIGDDGTIYVGGGSYLYAVSPAGKERWNLWLEDYVESSPAIGPDGTIYAGSLSKLLYAVDPGGEIKWTYDTGSPVLSSPAIGVDGETYIGAGSKVIALDRNGGLRWEFEDIAHPGDFVSSPAIGSDGFVYIGCENSTFYAIRQDTGEEVWSFSTDGPIHASPSIGVDGTVYISSYDAKLYSFQDGALVLITGVSPSPAAGLCEEAVDFDVFGANVSGDGLIYEWDFGGGATPNTSSEKSPEVTLGEAGTYNCSITVELPGVNTDIFNFSLTVNAPPVAEILADVTYGDAPLTVNFDASASMDPNGTIDQYEWDFDNDGTYDAVTVDPEVSHVFTEDQTYITRLRVTDNEGEQDTDFLVITLPIANETSEWWMFGRERTHNRRSPYIASQTNNVKWTYPTGQRIHSSPAIGPNGRIYVGSNDWRLHAVNPDGSEHWTYLTGSIVYSSPAIAPDGSIYVGSWDNRMHAVDAAGNQKWFHVAPANVNSSPAIGVDGLIYIGCNDNPTNDARLYALTPVGNLIWGYNALATITSSPAIAPDGMIYVGSDNKQLHAINPDGTGAWANTLGGDVDSSPAIRPDGSIVVTTSYYIYAFNPDGTTLWKRFAGYSNDSSPAIGADGSMYYGSRAGWLIAISPEGHIMWVRDLDGQITTSPALGADGTIYLNHYGIMYAYSPEGDLKWSASTGSTCDSSPAISSDGTVYVGGGDGNLYAFGPYQ